MNVRQCSRLSIVAALVAMGTGVASARAMGTRPSPAEVELGMEVLTRGPVHEAFAGTVTFDPRPGIVVPKAPPDIIVEVPPDRRPEGINVTWIPGYWSWDDERNDYLWVSGIWRALPPDRQWVPGYWGQSRQSIQWTSGYWADASISEVEYLPEPPPTIEAGPTLVSPSPNHIWIPGSWVWYQGRYAWRPGYWATVQSNWIWVPAHYVWAPRGYVFVDGYWDYAVDHRGVLFAPVYFEPRTYARRGFSYSPTTVINLTVFRDHLFVRSTYGHYYFGDYYAVPYQASGFSASFSFNSTRRGYDPIYAHQRWEHRQDREWDNRVATTFQNRRDHEDARPPRTLTIQRGLETKTVRSTDTSRVVARPFAQLAETRDGPMRFQPVAKDERQQIVRRGQEITKFRQERYKLETTAADTPAQRPSVEGQPSRARIARSPIVAKSAAQLGRDHAPPKSHAAPKPDPRVEPARKSKAVSKDRGEDRDRDRK